MKAEDAGRTATLPGSSSSKDLSAARERALQILNGAAQSSVALHRRLQRAGFEGDVADAVVEEMVGYGYVDDAKLAQSLVARHQRQGYGRSRVAAALMARQIDPETVSAALTDIDRDAEMLAAQALAHKLWQREQASPHHDIQAARRRIAAALQRRGFDGELIATIVRRGAETDLAE